MRDSDFRNESAAPDPIADMVRFNVQQEFGLDCNWSGDDLMIGNRVVADGSMQPHEWLLTWDGTILKSDAASHGDDHFFPGPVSIGWDLAGIIVEWELTNSAREFLMDRFRQYSGRRLERRLDAFCLAYSVFRMSLCKMAIPTADYFEKQRLQRSYARYRRSSRNVPAKARTRGFLVDSQYLRRRTRLLTCTDGSGAGLQLCLDCSNELRFLFSLWYLKLDSI